jgi:hypothetical protein
VAIAALRGDQRVGGCEVDACSATRTTRSLPLAVVVARICKEEIMLKRAVVLAAAIAARSGATVEKMHARLIGAFGEGCRSG